MGLTLAGPVVLRVVWLLLTNPQLLTESLKEGLALCVCGDSVELLGSGHHATP